MRSTTSTPRPDTRGSSSSTRCTGKPPSPRAPADVQKQPGAHKRPSPELHLQPEIPTGLLCPDDPDGIPHLKTNPAQIPPNGLAPRLRSHNRTPAPRREQPAVSAIHLQLLAARTDDRRPRKLADPRRFVRLLQHQGETRPGLRIRVIRPPPHAANSALVHSPAPFAPDPSKLSDPTMIIGAGYPAVSLITATAVSAGQFTLAYSTGAGFPSATLSVQISNPHRRTTSSYGSQFSLLAGLAQVGPPLGGVYSSTANYQDIIEIPPRPGLRTLRVSAIPDTTDWQLAFLTTFQLDLSINVP